MKKERLNGEKKINCSNFKLKVGTINKKNPSVIYIDGSTFISPVLDKDDYTNDIKNLKKDLITRIKNDLLRSNLFKSKYILDFDVKTSGLKQNKKSFLSFQCHLCQNNIIPFGEITKKSNDIINIFINNIEKDFNKENFIIFKTKK